MDYGIRNIIFAFSITLLAGLSTGFGSLFALQTKSLNNKFISGTLGFSAGVMLYVSMIEIFAEAKLMLEELHGNLGYWITVLSFFMGVEIIALIDKFIPSPDMSSDRNDNLYRLGILSALAIGIHNFPEGISTFMGALKDLNLGISIGIAIAIHNIPEGIAVSVPIYYATRSKKKAFKYSFISGLSEPLGAIVGYFLLIRFLSDTMFGIIFAIVSGIMVYISVDELLPTAEQYGEHHIVIYGFVLGMATMALGLLLLS
jgi:ZIP family zinc transporter